MRVAGIVGGLVVLAVALILAPAAVRWALLMGAAGGAVAFATVFLLAQAINGAVWLKGRRAAA